MSTQTVWYCDSCKRYIEEDSSVVKKCPFCGENMQKIPIEELVKTTFGYKKDDDEFSM